MKEFLLGVFLGFMGIAVGYVIGHRDGFCAARQVYSGESK